MKSSVLCSPCINIKNPEIDKLKSVLTNDQIKNLGCSESTWLSQKFCPFFY